jgi:hypothetical protein
MIDPSIALNVRNPQLKSPTESYSDLMTLRSMQNQGELQGLQVSQEKNQMADYERNAPTRKLTEFNEREQARFQSILPAAMQTATYLQNNDVPGAANFLTQRLETLKASGIDSKDTEEALQALMKDPNSLLQASMGMIDVGRQMGLVQGSANEGFTLSPGQQRFDAMGNPIASVEDKPNLPTGMQINPETGQPEYMPEYLSGQQAIRGAGASQTNVNVGAKDPLAGYTETSIGTLSAQAQTAPTRMQQSEVGLNLLKSRIQSGNETGKWAPLKTEMSAWLGLNPDDVATAQMFDVKMGDKVMGRIQETKGAVSEKEMAYFSKISPGSDKEPFTNYVLLEIDRRAAEREMDKLNYVEEYIQNKGNLLGFDQWYLKNHDPYPEFDVNAMRKEFDSWKQGGNVNDDDSLIQRYLSQ